MMKMSTKKDYTLVYLPNFDVYLKFIESKIENKSTITKRSLPGYREIEILYKHIKIGHFFLDERFNISTSKLYGGWKFTIKSIRSNNTELERFNKTISYLKDKYNELKKSNFRYGDWENNGISPTLFIFLEDFIEYLKEDIRDFKINILLNENEKE